MLPSAGTSVVGGSRRPRCSQNDAAKAFAPGQERIPGRQTVSD